MRCTFCIGPPALRAAPEGISRRITRNAIAKFHLIFLTLYSETDVGLPALCRLTMTSRGRTSWCPIEILCYFSILSTTRPH